LKTQQVILAIGKYIAMYKSDISEAMVCYILYKARTEMFNKKVTRHVVIMTTDKYETTLNCKISVE